ncbi:MAG: Lrp/AsnC family transcriptional regulator [Pseudomonadota bacterium]
MAGNSEAPKRSRSPKEMGDDGSPEGIELNKQIIALLQQDGRMPYSAIATQVGVSEGTVRNRVRQLLDDNIITIQAEALPAALGYEFNGLTFVKVASGCAIDDVAKRLAAIPEVYYLIMVMGRFDLSVATYHKSQDDYRAFLTEQFYGQPDIAGIENSLVLKVHKMKLQWDLNG